MLLIKRETGSESGIGSSPATSYTSLNLEIVSVEQIFWIKLSLIEFQLRVNL